MKAINGEDVMMTVKQVAEELSVSTGLVRRLCNKGLIPQVRRNSRGYRVFARWQAELIGTLVGLRQAGLDNSELRRFARLYRFGSESLLERKAILETRKRQLWQELEDKQTGIDYLERQIEVIDAKITEKH